MKKYGSENEMAFEQIKLDEENEENESMFPGYLWKPQVNGEKRGGIFSRTETEVGDDSVLHHFNEDKENPQAIDDPELHWKMWGSTILDKLMAKAKPGLPTEVVFVGKIKNKTNKYYTNHYEVLQDKEGGEPSGSSSSTKKLQSMTEALKPEPRLDDAEILDMAHESETKTSEQEEIIKIARGWLNKITNDMIGEQRTVDEKTLKIEVYELSKIPTKDRELGVLEEEMAKEVFKLIDQKR